MYRILEQLYIKLGRQQPPTGDLLFTLEHPRHSNSGPHCAHDS